MRLLIGVIATLLLLTAEGRAGQGAAGGRPRPEPLRIDPLTASISGRITTADTGAPLRRAEVRAISDRGLIRMATTDEQGRFVVRDLPAGTFSLHASKTGFVPLYFGQRRPFERRATIALTEGEKASADVGLPRAGAITGRIVDTTGEPVMGARVQALRRRMVDGVRGLQSVGIGDTTDDTGTFRLYGLPPGDYYVTATPRHVEDRTGRLVAAAAPGRGAPIFFPGTANRDEAQRITVDVSGEARADMQLFPVRTYRVSGIVLSANGSPAAGAMVSLLARDLDFVGGADGMVPLQILDDAGADGRFELEGVPPGSFVLRAQTRPQMPAIDPVSQRLTVPGATAIESTMVPVTVADDVVGLTVTTSAGGIVDVVVVADQAASGPPPSTVRISVRMGDRHEMGTSHTGARMALTMASASRVFVDGLPDNWALKGIFLDNEDVTDKPVELRDGQNGMLRVVLTDRTSDVVGTVGATSFANTAANLQATVVVFADDERKWGYPSRFIRIARTSGQGAFRIPGLPPDETYRAIAVDYLEDGEESDPEFLQRMRERATRFSLREGEQQAIELRLIQR